MKKTMLLLGLIMLLCWGCSGDEGVVTFIPVEQAPPSKTFPYFFLTADGVTVEMEKDHPGNNHHLIDLASIALYDDLFTAYITFGGGYDSQTQSRIILTFDRNGKVLSAYRESFSAEYGWYRYYGFPYFPSNYFNMQIESIDEEQKRIKLTFSGDLYRTPNDMNSLSTTVSGEAYVNYDDHSDQQAQLSYASIPQYCTAKINNDSWKARQVDVNGIFTSTDAYKFEIHFTSGAQPGSYNFNSSSTDNYVKLYKFNPATLMYDVYNAQGTVAHSYREFHGATNYSFIGTFSFTGVNVNNPADVVTVTDGTFRSYQHF